MSLIDDTLSLPAKVEPIVPPWVALKYKKKADFISWFQKTADTLQLLSQNRIETFVNNLLWYTGEYDKAAEYQVRVPGAASSTVPKRIIPRIFNHLHDITEQRVSKLARLKPGFEVVPTNSEEKDRLLSRLLKPALDAMARRVKMEFLMQEVERWNAVFGEIYVSIEWNKHIGDRVAPKKYERVGDVDVALKAPWTVFLEPKRHISEVKWAFDIESIMHVEEARIRFKNNRIKEDGNKFIFCFNQDVEEKRPDEVVVWRLVVPPSQFLPEGNVTYVIGDEVVDQLTEYPYSHYGFPYERHTDIDVPGQLFPKSFYQQIKPIQHVYNKLTSIITRNILLTAHPHILMPKGAAKIEAFGNRATAIEYQGPVAPTIATFKSVPQEVFQFRNDVRSEIGQVSGIQGVSRGAPPAGARAASMLRFYEEQEEQRASTHIIKHNELIRNIYLKAASVICDYYPKGDHKRLIRVVGKENEYDIRAFSKVKISAEYDVVISNSTGFSESKTARLEEIELFQKIAPGLLSNDAIADIMEIKSTTKMYDLTTASIKQADDENERVLDGEEIAPPQEYQDLIAHWKRHLYRMNTSTWENSVPEDIKQRLTDHTMMTERLMEMKAEVNATFAQLLANLPGYPAFWTPTPKPPKEKAAQPEQPAQPQVDPATGMPLAPGALPQGLPPMDPAAPMPGQSVQPSAPAPAMEAAPSPMPTAPSALSTIN